MDILWVFRDLCSFYSFLCSIIQYLDRFIGKNYRKLMKLLVCKTNIYTKTIWDVNIWELNYKPSLFFSNTCGRVRSQVTVFPFHRVTTHFKVIEGGFIHLILCLHWAGEPLWNNTLRSGGEEDGDFTSPPKNIWNAKRNANDDALFLKKVIQFVSIFLSQLHKRCIWCKGVMKTLLV